MKGVLGAGIAYLKREGITGFFTRVIRWIPEYAVWQRTMFRAWLYQHVCWYRGRIRVRESRSDRYVKFKHIMGGLEYCKKNNQPYQILNAGESVKVVLPKCFEERQDSRKTLFDSPPIYITKFQDVEIYGATNLLTKEDTAISDLYERDRGKNRYDIEGGSLVVCHGKGRWIRVAYRQTDIVLEEAVSCVGWASRNYFHFMFEILSRLPFADEQEEYRSLPVLVDAAALAIPQMKELFDAVNIYGHPVVTVEEYQRIHVKNLIYVSRNLWMPPQFRSKAITEAADYIFDRSVAENIRKRVLDGRIKTEKSSEKRIYLSRRNCSYQRLQNGSEIEQIFAERGYRIIFPEELSFREQVAIFHNADIIVGATGAAFTNIVFCHEGAKAGIILPGRNDVYFFSNIADMVQVELIVLGADVVNKAKNSSEDTFALDTDKCERFIQYVESA